MGICNNGSSWKNRATWNVAAWIDKDAGLFHLAQNCQNYKEFCTKLKNIGILETPDEVSFSDDTLDISILDLVIKQSHVNRCLTASISVP